MVIVGYNEFKLIRQEAIIMIDLKGNPFYLKDEDIGWVENTLDGMDLKTKVGQLFAPIGLSDNEDYLKHMVQDIKIGAIMFRPGTGEEVQNVHKILQENSEVPLLVAANLETGGTGTAIDGTLMGTQMQVAATNNEEMAYKLGVICGREASAVGCNWAFAPVIDIDYNWRNPITNIRTYGSDPERVLRMGKAYMKGIQENGGCVSIKHFPGDGVDERDQHLLTTINSLTVEEWDETYGKVYKGLIDEGARTVMVGHIMQPAYSKMLRPDIEDDEIMPATLAPELLKGLLREKLGFNGMIVTDATPMAGFTMPMSREKAVPYSIAAGCDMFLFNKSLEEDFEYMMLGIEKGILTEERIDEAVTRILATKASLGLHKKKQEGTLIPEKSDLEILHCKEHIQWAKQCADQSITLVKDTQELLPLSLEKHKRVLLFILGDEISHFGSSNKYGIFKESLEKEGFQVTVFQTEGLTMRDMEQTVASFKDNYDVVLYFANLATHSNQTVVRITWAAPMGINVPWFIQDLPTAFISVANPYHLIDVPQVKTFINGYTSSEYVIQAIIDKMLGRSEFKGINPVDPFCGQWLAKI